MLLFIALLPNRSFAQPGEVVTNKTVISLHKLGIGKSVIITKINSSACNFDLSTAGLVSLKKSGIPEDIVSAMITKGSAPAPQQYDNSVATPVNNNGGAMPDNNSNAGPVQNNTQDQNSQGGGEYSLQPGLYYFNASTNEYVELDAAVLSNSKSGGVGEAALRSVSVLFNAKLKASLSNTEANLKINTPNPLFVFVFELEKTGLNDNNQVGSNVSSPNEFFLVRLKQGKHDREVVVGKSNGVGSDMGIDDKAKVDFSYKKIRKGLYEVSTNSPLLAGEYCFMFANSAASAQGVTHKVYDFSVHAK